MKSFKAFLPACLAVAATLGFSQVSHAANDSDIIMGFRTAATGDNDLLLNLGDFLSSPQFNSAGPQLLGNYSNLLIATFGSNWNTNPNLNLTWGIAGGTTAGTRVAYIDNTGAAYGSMTAANVSGITAQIGSLYAAASTLAIGSSMTIADNDPNGWTIRKGADVFGAPISKVTNDRFELTTDFSLASSKSTVLTAVTGSGAWTDKGTFTFSSNGDLTYTSAVPEPSTYGLVGAGALAAVAAVRRRRNKVA